VDKVTLAALEAVLKLYSDPEKLSRRLPTLRHLTRAPADIETQAQRLLSSVRAALGDTAQVEVVPVKSQIGSGSLPVDLLESHGIAVSVPGKRRSGAAAAMSQAFRALPAPVIGRVKDGAFIMDMRCLEREHEQEFVEQLGQLNLEAVKA
jgi:L-seryl-tRNA(Ser) seleniumtransferase